MTTSELRAMPSLGGATEWLNSEPLSPAGLRGRVVLVNFWTLTCINWLRSEPYVRAWSRAYRDDGLMVIGAHTPEFSFEHEINRVRQATRDRSIDYPVAIDNDYAIWEAFGNHYWPALYFIDADGIVRDDQFGEGRYQESERLLQRLLGIDREPVSATGTGVEAEADWNNLRSPETYLGYQRAGNFASQRREAFDQRSTYDVPDRLDLNQWPIPFRVLLDGQAPGPSHGADTDEDGNGQLRAGRLYQLVRQDQNVRERTLEITFLRPGAEAYVFTFG